MERKPKGYIVAIDGPAGAGKSTVSKQLAEALDGRLLDTGAMYRAVAYRAIRDRVVSEKSFGKIARGLSFDMNPKTGGILVDGEDLGSRLRTEKVAAMASHVSQFREVRESMTRWQRRLARKWSRKLPIVVEGRDIGTVVFPKVQFKFFVTADEEIRARRRFNELKRRGTKVTFREVLKKAQARDKQDSGRRLAPLKCPKDAIVVDTSNMGIGQVVHFMCNHIRARNTAGG